MERSEILVISSDFPPLVGTNTQRVQSFLRHMPRHGWQPTIVTQAIEDLSLVDLKDLERIPPDAKIIRVQNPDPFARRSRSHKQRHVAALPTVHGLRGPEHPKLADTTPNPANLAKQLGASWASNILKWGLRTFSYHPDALRPWADRVANEIMRGLPGDIRAIMSSSPAYSCHLAGLKIKLETGLPWIADFRDLWVGRPYRGYRSEWHKWRDKKLEARVIKHCDCLLVASPAWKDNFISRYGNSLGAKIAVLTNGYEAEYLSHLVSQMPAHQPGHKFVLTGSMHEAESPLPFLEALETIHKERPAALDRVEVILIGYAGDHLPALQEAASRTGISERIAFLSPRSNEECLKAQLDADYLIMFAGNGHKDTISGKSFEYMATGKPILACIPTAGIQADILRQAGTAIIVQHGDVGATARAILSLLNDQTPPLKPNWPYIRQFDRAKIARQLAGILARLVKNGDLCQS